MSSKHDGKRLVLVGLTRMTFISFLKAVRAGTGWGLAETKKAVETAMTRGGVLEVGKKKFDRVIDACDTAGLQAMSLTGAERVCLKVHDS